MKWNDPSASHRKAAPRATSLPTHTAPANAPRNISPNALDRHHTFNFILQNWTSFPPRHDEQLVQKTVPQRGRTCQTTNAPKAPANTEQQVLDATRQSVEESDHSCRRTSASENAPPPKWQPRITHGLASTGAKQTSATQNTIIQTVLLCKAYEHNLNELAARRHHRNLQWHTTH